MSPSPISLRDPVAACGEPGQPLPRLFRSEMDSKVQGPSSAKQLTAGALFTHGSGATQYLHCCQSVFYIIV